MADIELVIKIPEEIRLALINNVQLSLDQQSICDSYIKQAILNGTPLPKGHGRILDESQVTGTFIWDNGYIECYAPTIIEADNAESEN